LCFTDP